MSEKSDLPVQPAFDCADEPRFAMVAEERLPVLLEENRYGQHYREKLGSFDGVRDKFVTLANRVKKAVLAREVRGEWEMIGVYMISAIQTYDEPFECFVGQRIARLKEITPEL